MDFCDKEPFPDPYAGIRRDGYQSGEVVSKDFFNE
jgi:hypothetical protein